MMTYHVQFLLLVLAGWLNRVVSKNTNELKTRLGCNKQVQMAKQPGGHKWPARWPEYAPTTSSRQVASERPLRTTCAFYLFIRAPRT